MVRKKVIDAAIVRAEYARGTPMREIGLLFGVSQKVVHRTMLDNGIPVRKKGLAEVLETPDQVERILAMHAAGSTPKDISRTILANVNSVRKVLRNRGEGKWCSLCERVQPLDAFYATKNRKKFSYGVHSYCKECACRHPSQKARRNAYHARNKDRLWWMHVGRTYGISEADFNAIFAAQGHRCGICRRKSPGSVHLGKSKRWHIDHVHGQDRSSKKRCQKHEVRGILCNGCNLALGMVADSIKTLRRAIRYLKSPPAGQALIAEPALQQESPSLFSE